MSEKQLARLNEYRNTGYVVSVTMIDGKMILVTEQRPMSDGSRMIYVDVYNPDGELIHNIEGI